MSTVMKRIAQIGLCILSLGIAQTAMAKAGVVFEMTGTAQATSSTGGTRSLMQGDVVNEGDTLSTGVNSLLTIRFLDQHLAAMVSKSKMVIEAYAYDPADATKSKVTIAVLEGGVRTVTGLIGKARPEAITFKGAGATIGVKGTDIIIMVNDGNVILQVLGGVATLIVDGMVRVVSLGQAGIKTKDGRVTGVNAEQLSQTLTMLFPNNTNIQTVATDLNANAAKIDAAQTAQTGTTVINTKTDTTKKTDVKTNTDPSQVKVVSKSNE